MSMFRRDKPFDDLLKSVLNDARQSMSAWEDERYAIKPAERQSNLIPYYPSPDRNSLVPTELRDMFLDTLELKKYRINRITGDEIMAIEVTIYRGKIR